MVTETFRRIDGIDLLADVFRPAGASEVPALLWLHGGGLIGGRRTDLVSAQCDRYIDSGWAVIAVDYRLAPEASIEAVLDDVDAAWAWLLDVAPRHHLDINRLGVVGHSAGGYLTLARGAGLRPRPRALVSFYGYGDVAGPWYTQPSERYLLEPPVTRADALKAIARTPSWAEGDLSERMLFYLHCRQQGSWPSEVIGDVAGADGAGLERYCPALHVTADHPPTLLIHGAEDDDVPVERSTEMAAALRAAGVPHELVVVPGLGHGFDGSMDDDVVSATFEQARLFLASYLS